MHAYAVGSILHAPQMRLVQFLLFHGNYEEEPPLGRASNRFLGRIPDRALSLVRNVTYVPPVFAPGSRLIVSSEARSALQPFYPRIDFLSVDFSKVFRFPFCRVGDTSFERSPEFLAARDSGRLERFLDFLEPDPAPCNVECFEVIVPRLSDLQLDDVEVQVTVKMKYTVTRRNDMKLSRTLFQKHPIIWWNYYIFNQDAFDAIEPFLEKEYFEVVAIDL